MNQKSENSRTPLAYGIADALALVPVGRSLLYEEIRAGRLRAYRIGKRRLIDSADLAAWLNSYKIRTGNQAVQPLTA